MAFNLQLRIYWHKNEAFESDTIGVGVIENLNLCDKCVVLRKVCNARPQWDSKLWISDATIPQTDIHPFRGDLVANNLFEHHIEGDH